MIGEENIEKWTQQANTFANFNNTVKDVCEYLTRELNLYVRLLEAGSYNEANKVRKNMLPYDGMFRVFIAEIFKDYKYSSYHSIGRNQGTLLSDFILNQWTNSVQNNYYITNGPEYIVINY